MLSTIIIGSVLLGIMLAVFLGKLPYKQARKYYTEVSNVRFCVGRK